MPSFRSKRLARLILKLPGFQTFGYYSLLPVCFLSGAALEFTMIKWHFGEANFYKTYKQRQATEKAEAIVNEYIESKKRQQS